VNRNVEKFISLWVVVILLVFMAHFLTSAMGEKIKQGRQIKMLSDLRAEKAAKFSPEVKEAIKFLAQTPEGGERFWSIEQPGFEEIRVLLAKISPLSNDKNSRLRGVSTKHGTVFYCLSAINQNTGKPEDEYFGAGSVDYLSQEVGLS